MRTFNIQFAASLARCWVLLVLVLVLANSSSAFAQNSQQRLEYLNAQMAKDHAAGNYVQLERNAREYLKLAQPRQNVGLFAVGHFWLGKSLVGQEKFADAEENFKASYSYSQKDYPLLAIDILVDLAGVYADQARFADAEETFQTAIKAMRKEYGETGAELVKPIVNLSTVYRLLRRDEDAAKQLELARGILYKQPELNHRYLFNVLYGLGVVRYNQFRYDESEQMYQQASDIIEKTYGRNSAEMADVQGALGLLYRVIGRMGDAEQASKRSVEISLVNYGLRHTATATNQAILADFYRVQGRFNEAETLANQVWETRDTVLGPDHPLTANSPMNLGYIYEDQSRHREALPLFQRTLEVYQKTYGPRDPRTLRLMNSLGFVLGALARFEAAEKLLQEALSAVDPESYDAATINANLAQVLTLQNKLQQAEPMLLRALSIKENDPIIRPDDARLTSTLSALGALYLRMKNYPAARKHVQRQINILQKEPRSGGELAIAYSQRARINRAENKLADAAADLNLAMDLADQQRTSYSGSDTQRSEAFNQMTLIFERMVQLQTELGDVGEAYMAMERGRARSLLDQLAVQGVDLLQGIPEEKAKEIRQQLAEIASFQAKTEQRAQELSGKKLQPAQERALREEVTRNFQTAQQLYIALQAEIRNLSPAFRLAIGKDQQPVDLQHLQDYVTERKGLLLRYLVGIEGSYLLIVPAGGEARLEKLAVTEEIAQTLGIPAGEITTNTLTRAFADQEQTGVMQLFRGSRDPQINDRLTQKLAALWKLLIPEKEREGLTAGTYQQLIVIPDGALAMLPFSALVVESDSQQIYALDACPPVVYALSATILNNLAARNTKPAKSDRKPVLTVGDPTYHTAANVEQNPVAVEARYGALGGHLQSLPFSGLEAQWVSEIFGREGIQVGKLTKMDATERNVVFNIPGRSIVHLGPQ